MKQKIGDNINNNRPDLDQVPASINQKNEKKRRGKLKIFFGMSPGVGKTYSMLQTALQDLARGVDIVVGYMESGNYSETEALLKGLEIIPRRKTGHDNAGPEEMDLDAIIARHPYLVVVDQLAHTNAKGSRHAKRYQDVHELLDNGINVYTTLNIQNLESRCDIISQIMGITVTETVPDEMFEITDDVELIDITSTAFFDRLVKGKVRGLSQSQEVKQNFYKRENIITLREMALRLVTDRVDKQLKSYVQQKQTGAPLTLGFRLLVLVGESESTVNLLRRAKNLSYSVGANLVALHVENGRILNQSQREQLAKNINLARNLGAEVIIMPGRDLVSTALEVARKENATHIVIGKPRKQNPLSCFFSGGSLVNRLLKDSGTINVYIVQSETEILQPKRKLALHTDSVSQLKQYAIVTFAIPLIALICLPIAWATGYHVSFIMCFIVLALAWTLRLNVGPVALASALSAYTWGYFFVPPIYTMKGMDTNDLVAIIVFFFIALVVGILTSNVRKNERLIQKREEKTDALFHLTDRLASANRFKEIISMAKEETYKYFGVEIYFLLQDGFGSIDREQKSRMPSDFTDSDFGMAQWTFKHSKKSGRYTDTFPAGKYTFYPMSGIHFNLGVAVVKHTKKLDNETEIFGVTFLRQISNALEHHYYSLRAKNANLLFESDKLYKSLFNSVSHEMRIPVATIMGASDTLLSNEYPEDIKKKLYTEIFTASNRLNRLIENLLNISRLENKKIVPRIDWVDINDLFNQVVNSLEEDLKPFCTDIVVPESMPLVKLDFGLMEQALYNLVDNSCKYALPGTTIRIKSFYDNDYLVIQEMDRGPGFIPDELPLVFNKFYRAESMPSGGLGLGLSIVKGFIDAHNGSINVENRRHGGAKFTIKIPTEISYIT